MNKKCTCGKNKWKTIKKVNGIRKVVSCRGCRKERALTTEFKNQTIIDSIFAGGN